MNSLLILQKLSPAFLYIILGYIAKKKANLSQYSISNILFFICIPLVVFKAILYSDLGKFSFLVILSFCISILMAGIAYLFRHYFSIAKGMLMCLFSYFNIGWFGIPVVHAIYGNEAGNIMTALYVGGMLFGNTIGYTLATDTPIKANIIIKKIFTVPAFYAFLLGFIIHYFPLRDVIIQSSLNYVFNFASLLTSILGMGLVGMSVVNIEKNNINYLSLTKLLLVRFFSVLLIVFIINSMAKLFGLLNDLEIKILYLLPFLPIAANLLVFVTKNKSENNFVGLSLLLSTIISCFMLIIIM